MESGLLSVPAAAISTACSDPQERGFTRWPALGAAQRENCIFGACSVSNSLLVYRILENEVSIMNLNRALWNWHGILSLVKVSLITVMTLRQKSLDFVVLVTIRNALYSVSFSAALAALHCVAKTKVFELFFHIYLDELSMYSTFITRWLVLTIFKNYYACLECKKKKRERIISYIAMHIQCVIWNLNAVTKEILLFHFSVLLFTFSFSFFPLPSPLSLSFPPFFRYKPV